MLTSIRNTKVLPHGFTLLEILMVVAIVAILSAIALPSYERYVRQSKAKSAASDLVSLSLSLENYFQKKLSYPDYYTKSTLIPAALNDRKGTLASDFSTWVPSQDQYFDYYITSSASSYSVSAQSKGLPSWCTLVLNDRNERQSEDCSVLKQWQGQAQ